MQLKTQRFYGIIPVDAFQNHSINSVHHSNEDMAARRYLSTFLEEIYMRPSMSRRRNGDK